MPENSPSTRSPRHAILDLAPLELDCMTVIWSLGAGTVRDIQDKLKPTRPRAYTTVMTIMDRLAQKGIVSRQKIGRAYRYRANLSSDDARHSAVQKVIAGFFNGSTEALASHLVASYRVNFPVPDSHLAAPNLSASDLQSATESTGAVKSDSGITLSGIASAACVSSGPQNELHPAVERIASPSPAVNAQEAPAEEVATDRPNESRQ